MSEDLLIRRVARAAGISVEQARLARAAMPEPPSGGPAYVKRMGYVREAAESLGLKGVWRMTDATLEKRVCRNSPRMRRLIDYAKQADAEPSSA